MGRIDRAAMLDYLRRHYAPANLVISVAGNVTHAEVVREAEEWFGTLPPGEPMHLTPAALAQTAPRAGVISRCAKLT